MSILCAKKPTIIVRISHYSSGFRKKREKSKISIQKSSNYATCRKIVGKINVKQLVCDECRLLRHNSVGRNVVSDRKVANCLTDSVPELVLRLWERRLTSIFYPSQAVYLLWWPSLRKDVQTESKKGTHG